MDDNDFLQSLAKGGIQVGELAKLYYPGGYDVKSLDYKEAQEETIRELVNEKAVVYEAAVQYDNCFIRVDVLEKKGKRMNLIEVKSKSWSPEEEFYSERSGAFKKSWQKYLYDVGFQY